MKNILYVFFPVLLFSCVGYKTSVAYNEIETICQDSFVTLADLYGQAEMIPLENKEEAMISDVLKMEVTPDGFFIRDLYGGGYTRVLFFDNNGGFVTQIGNMGKGKEEFLYMDDMAVDKTRKEVAILTMGQEIKRYGYDGKYKDEISLQDDVRYEKLCCAGDMYICSARHNDKDDSLVCIFNRKGELVSKHVASLPMYISDASFVGNPIQTNGNKMLYVDYFKSMFTLVDLKKPMQESTCKMDLDNMFVYKNNPGEDNKDDEDRITSGYYVNDVIYGWMNHNKSLCYYQIDLTNNKACICPSYDWTPLDLCVTDGFAYAALSQDQVMKLCVHKSPYTNSTKDMLSEAFKSYADRFSMMDNFVILKMKSNNVNLLDRK